MAAKTQTSKRVYQMQSFVESVLDMVWNMSKSEPVTWVLILFLQEDVWYLYSSSGTLVEHFVPPPTPSPPNRRLMG